MKIRAPDPEPVEAVALSKAAAAELLAAPASKKSDNAKAFEDAATRLLSERREDVKASYPELIHWEKTP